MQYDSSPDWLITIIKSGAIDGSRNFSFSCLCLIDRNVRLVKRIKS
jgi:hypothetical protein